MKNAVSLVPLSKVATCAPQFIGVVNETQYYPRRTRPFYGLTYLLQWGPVNEHMYMMCYVVKVVLHLPC